MSSVARSARRKPKPSRSDGQSVVQFAALCHRPGPDGLEVLLVRSSRGRWILPKGWPIDGLSGGQTALQEAWEEGGVSDGKPAKRALAVVETVKRTNSGREMPCEMHVYPIKVRQTQPEFPESEDRDPAWVSVSDAVDMIEEEGLKDILSGFGAKAG